MNRRTDGASKRFGVGEANRQDRRLGGLAPGTPPWTGKTGKDPHEDWSKRMFRTGNVPVMYAKGPVMGSGGSMRQESGFAFMFVRLVMDSGRSATGATRAGAVLIEELFDHGG